MTENSNILTSDASKKLKDLCEANDIVTFRQLIGMGPIDLKKLRGMTDAIMTEIDNYAKMFERIKKNYPVGLLMCGDYIETEDGITRVYQVCENENAVWSEANPFIVSNIIRPVKITSCYLKEDFWDIAKISRHSMWHRRDKNGEFDVKLVFLGEKGVECSIFREHKAFTSITINYLHELQHILKVLNINEYFVLKRDILSTNHNETSA